MSGGGGDPHPPSDNSGGEFLLSLLQRPPSQQPQPQPQPQSFLSPPHRLFQQTHHLLHHQHQQNPNSLVLDPAVTAVGPSFPFAPHLLLQSDSPDLGFSHTASSHNTWQNSPPLSDDFSRLGYRNPIHDLSKFNQRQELDHKLQFGSFRNDGLNRDGTGTEVSLNANSNVNLVKERNLGLFRNDVLQRESSEVLLNSANVNSSVNLVNERNLNLNSNIGNYSDRRGVSGRGKEHYGGNHRAPPPGFKPRGRGGGSWDHGNRRKELESNVSRGKGNHGEFSSRNVFLNGEEEKFRSGEGFLDKGIARQLDRPGLPAGSNLHSVSGLDVEESFMKLEADGGDEGKDELDEVGEELVDSLLLDGEADSKKDKKQNRHPREDYRSDSRGQRILSQRVRMLKRQMECRGDIDRWNAPFLSIYNSLIPPEEEKAKQKQLLTLLETLVNKEWPDARLYLYGSCANSFGVLKSDIDVCLAMEDADVNKAEILTKLADILQSDNLQNVQALTRARVPIVKLMDPVTGISCDICINNILAVVNTKLLRDYAQIDERLRQLAFIVKHWAKSRGVNETYQGTLSSYAYVLMCIHFLQQRRPAILPCLQEMESTHSVIVDDIKCSFFDQVEKLHGFGSSNRETIAQLVWAFFNYWAYRHDYTNDVISVRTGSIISKREKEWTRRIGNDRHLICIEDPFETSHDLGRVVDKFSIRVLREEFERAAEIMQYDPNPCVTLFQPYVPT